MNLESTYALRYDKTGNESMQLALQHCYKKNWMAILHFLPAASKSDLLQIRALDQAFDAVFHHQIKHLEIRQKYSAHGLTPAFFHPIRSQYLRNL